MFCPKCGKADQQTNAYCRNCGEFLPDFNSKKRALTIGGDTPEEQIRDNLILNFLSGTVSFILAIVLYATFRRQPDVSPVIYMVAGFLLAMCGWQFSTFRVGLKLRKTFRKRIMIESETVSQTNQNAFESAKTQDLLPKADYSNIVPASVTENTTKTLGEKIKNRSA